jgi:hypothetical protein
VIDHRGALDSETCYRCERRASTVEHAPPRCFFPETKDVGRDLRRNLITVPSCSAHNTARSEDDEYAMVFVVTHYETRDLARRQFSSKVIRALQRSPTLTKRVFHKPRRAMVHGLETVSVTVDVPRVTRVLDSTCRALLYHHQKRKLLVPLRVWSPAFRHPSLERDANEAVLAFEVRRVLDATPRLGENPEVFWYQLYDDPARVTAFRLEFYEGFSVYAVVGHAHGTGATSDETAR